jgi:hypothetical protein
VRKYLTIVLPEIITIALATGLTAQFIWKLIYDHDVLWQVILEVALIWMLVAISVILSRYSVRNGD